MDRGVNTFLGSNFNVCTNAPQLSKCVWKSWSVSGWWRVGRRGRDDQCRRLNVTPLQPTTMRACAGPSDAPEALSRVEGEMKAFQIRSALIWSFWKVRPRDGLGIGGGREDVSAAGPGRHRFLCLLQWLLKKYITIPQTTTANTLLPPPPCEWVAAKWHIDSKTMNLKTVASTGDLQLEQHQLALQNGWWCRWVPAAQTRCGEGVRDAKHWHIGLF